MGSGSRVFVVGSCVCCSGRGREAAAVASGSASRDRAPGWPRWAVGGQPPRPLALACRGAARQTAPGRRQAGPRSAGLRDAGSRLGCQTRLAGRQGAAGWLAGAGGAQRGAAAGGVIGRPGGRIGGRLPSRRGRRIRRRVGGAVGAPRGCRSTCRCGRHPGGSARCGRALSGVTAWLRSDCATVQAKSPEVLVCLDGLADVEAVPISQARRSQS